MVKINRNEIVLRDRDCWLYFSDARRTVCAEKLDDVIPALLEVERLVDTKGWYAAGFLSYESASAFDPAFVTKPTTGFPHLWFGFYSEPRTVCLPKPSRPKQVLNWQPTVDRAVYNAAIAKIQQCIAQGKTYQVNYTMRLKADFNSDPWDFFLRLAQKQNNHAAYIDLGCYAICSASPELFFELEGEKITCRPMKGTVKRGRTTTEDQQAADWLRSSEKNRAENVMIVDMIRNDLGRIARTGSVEATELFSVERYPTLWQMTSTVSAQTRSSLTEIFRALFPCASITGAPKVSTMNIIHELENAPRKIYTGCIGYVFPQRKAKFNVAIRTVLLDGDLQQAEYGTGGGIIWDSNSTDEYAEALLKAQVISKPGSEFSLLETMLWTPDEGYYLYDKHVDRVLDSANYFDFPASREALQAKLNEAASTFNSQQRVRLLVERTGSLTVEATPFQRTETSVRAHLAKHSINSNNVLLFHKTTQRDIYEKARGDYPDLDDVLLFNERGELTEFTIGNLVVELDGQLVTPPIECGVLAGTFRAHILEGRQVAERVVFIRELKNCTQIFRVNSIRKWESVQISI